MAVSKALRGHGDISVETRERVRRRAEELNYRANLVARSLVTGHTFLIGLVVPDLMQSFFAEIAGAVSNVLRPEGYHVLIANSGEDAATEIADIETLVSRNVDGLIIASAQQNGDTLRGLKTPYVLIDRTVPDLDANFIGTDNEEAGFLATEHLVQQGCQRIVHLRGPAVSSAHERVAGYERSLRAHGRVEPRQGVWDAGHDDAAGYATMNQILKSDTKPDGAFCYNDPVAIGAMRAILETGLSVPRDIALVGVANTHFSDMLMVPLTTLDQHAEAIGEQAARMLLSRLSDKNGNEPQVRRIPPTLLVRTSSQRQP